MAVQTDRSRAFITWLIFVAVVCHNEATAAQGPHGPAFGPAVAQAKHETENVEIEKLSSLLPPIERALQGIRRRAAGDRTLKQLADATIRRQDYADAKGKPTAYKLSIGASTDDQIDIPTNGDPASMKLAGWVSLSLHYDPIEGDGIGTDIDIASGAHNGTVTWRTDDPKVLVRMFWLTKDPGAPDRLLAIVREELEREGLRLLPTHKLGWPVATTSERLSQLLPPDSLPPVAPPAKTEVASPQGPAKVFASPYDVVAAYNQAVAKKDWQASARCLTPASQVGAGKPIECEGVRIEGDKASGYWIDRRPAPAPEEVEMHGDTYYLPRYFPIRFRRIDGSWLIEW